MSEVQDEYRTIVSRGGWALCGGRGRLRLDGRDGLSFLHGLVTNDVARLDVGQGTYAAYLTPQGRMIADVEVYRRPDGVWLSLVGPTAPLAERLDQLVFAEDVRIADLSATTFEILVVDETRGARLAAALGADRQGVEDLGILSQLEVGDAFIVRVDEAPLPSFRIIGPAAAQGEVVGRLAASGFHQMSGRLVEALRVEAGRPVFGQDMTTDTIPLEAGLLERAISTEKGCYVGQEVIIRVLHRGGGRVARRLVTLSLEGNELPEPGAALSLGADVVGAITSAARALTANGTRALAYVRREVAEPGTVLSVGAENAPAQVTGLAR